MCRIKKVENYSSYEEYEQNVSKNFKKYIDAKNGVEIFDTYEEYEQNVAIKSQEKYQIRKFAEKAIGLRLADKYITDDYKNDIDKKLDYYTIELEKEDKKYIYNYLIHIDNLEETKYLSFNEKIEYAKYLMKYDKETGYNILMSTPILKSGTLGINLIEEEVKYNGKYLEYFNPDGINVTAPLIEYRKDEKGNIKEYAIEAYKLDDYIMDCNKYYKSIMQKTYNKYSEKFRNQVLNNMKKITLINGNYNRDWAGFCTPIESTKSTITIDMQDVMNDYSYMQSAYTHELGHVFAFASSSKTNFFINNMLNNSDIHDNAEWKSIYKQINKNDPSHNLLRDYAHSDQYECFAECVVEYYADSSDDIDFNPNDLKTIDIEVDGKEMTLYDYMDQLLN